MRRGPKKTLTIEEELVVLQSWLPQAVCAAEHREPNKSSQDPDETKWWKWLNNVRTRQPKMFVDRVNAVVASCGCT